MGEYDDVDNKQTPQFKKRKFNPHNIHNKLKKLIESNNELKQQNNNLIKTTNYYKQGLNIWKKEANKWKIEYVKL